MEKNITEVIQIRRLTFFGRVEWEKADTHISYCTVTPIDSDQQGDRGNVTGLYLAGQYLRRS